MSLSREFTSGAELKAHYAALIAKRNAVKPAASRSRPDVKSIPIPPRPTPAVLTRYPVATPCPSVAKPTVAPPRARDWLVVSELKDAVPVSLSSIMDACAYEFQVTSSDIRGERRMEHISRARHVYFYLAYTLTSASFPKIGNTCGGRDHSTVWIAVCKIKKNYEKFRPNIESIKAMLSKFCIVIDGERAGKKTSGVIGEKLNSIAPNTDEHGIIGT